MYGILKKCTYTRKKEVLVWKNNYMYRERDSWAYEFDGEAGGLVEK